MWKGKQKRIRSSVLLCTSTLESWTEVLTASTCSEARDIIIQLSYGQTDGTPNGSKTSLYSAIFQIKQENVIVDVVW